MRPTHRHASDPGVLSGTWLLSLLAAVVVACGAGGAAFDIHFADNRPADVAAIAGDIATHSTASPSPLVALVPVLPAQGMSVFALPDGRRLWQSSAHLDTRPVIAHDLVISHSASSVVGWDAQSGAERWRVADRGYALIGAGGDGNFVAISLGGGGLENRRGRFLVLDAHSGAAKIDEAVHEALGVPAVAGAYAVVPWDGQYLSVFDVRSGTERTRIRSTDDLFGRVSTEPGAVYFGGRSLYRLGREAGAGHRDASATFVMSRDDLPGHPPLMGDGYVPSYAGMNAHERVTVLFRNDPAQPGVAFTDGLVYVLFYRVLFALDMTSQFAVRWAYLHPADIVGAQAFRGGIGFVDSRGDAVALDAAHGTVSYRHALGLPAAQAVLNLPIDFSPPREGDEHPTSTVSNMLAVVASTDARLAPAQLFAAQALANFPGDEATRGLVEIAGHLTYSQDLRAAAGEALAHRTGGIDVLIAALGTHYSYVADTAAPPVGFIARALANSHDRRAVAALVAHLEDPETPANQLPPLMGALRDFADPATMPALLDFLRLYHSDEGVVPPVAAGDPVNERTSAEQEAISSALELAVQAVAQNGNPADHRWLNAMLDDTNTLPSVRAAIQRAVAPSASAAPSNSASADEPQADTPDDPNIPPPRLTTQMIQDGFVDLRDRMLHCLDGLQSRPVQIRIQFRYDGSGNVSTPTVTPPSLQACIGPIAGQAHFRTTQVSREIGTYYLIGGQ